MVKAIHIKQKLDSETLYLPQLRPWLGKNVEIVVRESPQSESGEEGATIDLRGSVLAYHDPFAPAAPADEWESNA